MTKTEFIQELAEKLQQSQAQTAQTLEAVFAMLQASLAKGEPVNFIGFGSWEVKERAERAGRNPATGKTMTIPAKRVITFKAGNKLKAAVNETRVKKLAQKKPATKTNTRKT